MTRMTVGTRMTGLARMSRMARMSTWMSRMIRVTGLT